ncbi:uncharacterized protein pclob isoform X8 [Stigmatopora argus]
MFSSKFLSGSNPLSAMSSAVNKFGLFGDDGDGDKTAKGGQQLANPSKGPPQQKELPKSNQGAPVQRSQPSEKQGPQQPHGNGQAGPPKQSGGQLKGSQQQGTPKPVVQSDIARAGTKLQGPQIATTQSIPPQGSPKPSPQQPGPPKPSLQQQGSSKPSQQQSGPPKPSPQEQGFQKPSQTQSGSQQPGPPKPTQQQSGPPKPSPQQQGFQKPSQTQSGPPKLSTQQQGSLKPSPQQQGSTKPSPQQQGSPKPSPQQQGSPKPSPQQQGSPKPSPQQQGSPKPSPQQQKSQNPSQTQTGPPKPSPQNQGPQKPSPQLQGPQKPSPQQQPSSPKAAPQQASSKIGSSQQVQQGNQKGPPTPNVKKGFSLCPVCNTTKLNMHTKEPPNHKTCTQCKTEVCSLCGFSPPDADASEWLCLTCQIKRAEAPPTKRPTPSPSKMPPPSVSASPNKTQTTSGAKTEATKGQASPKHVTADSRKQHLEKSGPKATGPQESGGLFGFGASKTAKPEESVTGKMFGFGSSIFSSASTLITSAVQDEPKTTPPISPHVQSKNAVQEKKLQPEPPGVPPGGRSPSDPLKSPHVPTKGQSSCPLCKMVLNVGSKDPPNYRRCTECKSTVCNQCGFNPMPNVKEGKEWLCLNCQVKRTTSEIDVPKDITSATSSTKMTPALPAVQKTPTPGSPHRAPGAQPSHVEAVKAQGSQKQAASALAPKAQQESVKADQQKKAEQPQKQGNATETPHQESGGFFGFGSPKKQPEANKPAESVTGKMFGFGSSIFSSASTLISSAVEDEPKPAPPASPKMSAPKDLSSVNKSEKKMEQSQQPKGEKLTSEPMKKITAPLLDPKPVLSSCPVCKSQLNIGSKDPPNYNTCTGCKNTVCNQCGFSPVPNVKEVKEWLCLNCQMQRALGASDPPGTPLMKPQASPNKSPASVTLPQKETQQQSQTKDDPMRADSKTKEMSAKQSPKTEVTNQKPTTPSSGVKAPSEEQKKAPQNRPEEKVLPEAKQTNAISKAQEDPHGPKPQSDMVKPTDSIGGKMFSLGSSIFTSASTLMNSAGQDESKTNASLSLKTPATNVTKAPLDQEREAQKTQESKSSTPSKTPSDLSKEGAVSQPSSKSDQSNCPLCKVELNHGSKDPPNYSKCTGCKSTVCNQCGFSPVPNISKVKEWLCLNCQMQRALNASEPSTKPPNAVTKTLPSSLPQKTKEVESIKKDVSKPDMLPKMQTAAAPNKGTDGPVPSTLEKTKPIGPIELEKNKQSTPKEPPMKVSERPLDPTTISGPKQSNVPSNVQKEPSKQLGLNIPRTTSDASKTTDSISGKMFGFGSSIFSSASTLISTAVQEDSRTTPPSSRKMSAPVQVSPKISGAPKLTPKTTPKSSPIKMPLKEAGGSAREVKESHQSKQDKVSSQTPKIAKETHTQENCPLCNIKLNIGSKEPPNYSICSECRTTVCDKCGFNPMPNGEKKEWLCLTCQMKRVVEASEQSASQNQLQAANDIVPAAVKSTPTSKPITLQTEVTPKAAETQQEKLVSVKPNKPEAATAKLVSSAPDVNLQQKIEKTVPAKPTDPVNKPAQKQTNATATKPQETGGFFGFGATKSKPAAEKPTDSVSEKMFGFGSSIFSSASTLITSAVQDPAKTSPSASPQKSPVKDLKSAAPQKQEPQKKSSDSTLQEKVPPSGPTKRDNDTPKRPQAAEANKSAVKTSSTCPLCKVELHQDNSNSCTECKNIVCNQCGFNPMPNETKVQEWLCLTCQMQRALGESNTPGVVMNNSQPAAKVSTAEPEKKVAPTPISPQRQPAAGTAKPAPALEANKPDGPKDSISSPIKKTPQDLQNMPSPRTPPGQIRQAERKKSNASESGGFFGFSSSKAQSDASKTAESVTGKMFGFGSSIFSNASTLINSTPPVSPKMSPTRQAKTPSVLKKEEQTKSDKTELVETASSEQIKVEKSKKEAQSTCPLCKVEINVGSKGLPNYDTCTNCKSAVCKQCGFTPMPNVSEEKEWLCLTCQMQRALSAAEAVAPPLIKPQPSAKKETSPAASSTNEIKDRIPMQKAVINKDEKMATITQQINEETPASVSVGPKDIKTMLPPTKEVQISSEEKPTVGSLSDQPPTVQTLPVRTDVDSSLEKKDHPLPSSLAKADPSPVLEMVGKSLDQEVTIVDNKQTKTTKLTAEDPKLVENTMPRSTESTAKATQETERDSQKSPRAGSKTTEAVSGKMMGFGSSLFSSASSLITSAVREESRTTPLSSRKMSAPAQGSVTVLPPQIPPVKLSPAVSPLKTSTKEAKTAVEKASEQTQSQIQAPPAETKKADPDSKEPSKQEPPKAAQKSTNCPLCKVLLNTDSKDLPNYNICTGCECTVCNKCGFSPTPNKADGKEWLCLNCQMQRALGTSEPLGLPLIKSHSPSKETPILGKDTIMPASQEDPVTLQTISSENKVVSVVTTKECKSPVVGEPTDKTTSATGSLPEKSAPAASKKTDVASVVPEKTPEKQTGLAQKQPAETVAPNLRVVTSEGAKIAPQQPAKAAKSPVKSAPPPNQPVKQESGGFFGFAGTKTQPSTAKSAESVTGKMFGFGSSFLNSASNLITSAVQDETKTTPPTPRKMSLQASPKTTPPASPKTTMGKDKVQIPLKKEETTLGKDKVQIPLKKEETTLGKDKVQTPLKKEETTLGKDKVQTLLKKEETTLGKDKVQTPLKKEETKLDKPQEKTTPVMQDKVVQAASPKAADTPLVPKGAQSTCPLCKVQLNMARKDAPNFNTCTECKTIVCNQCGFSPIPSVSEVKEWLCLNCQMKRALGASEPAGPSAVKPQPLPVKMTSSASRQNDTVIQQEKSTIIKKEDTRVDNKVPQPPTAKNRDPLKQGSMPTPKDPALVDPIKDNNVIKKTQQIEKPQRVDDSQTPKTEMKVVPTKPVQPSESPIPPVTSTPPPVVSAKKNSAEISQTTKPQIKASSAKPAEGKPPIQPSKTTMPPTKTSPQPAKKESGGLFGFGAPKTQPVPSAKPTESVTGKMFGFGSSIFNSASTLITSAVQEETKTTLPVSPKISPAKTVVKPQAPQQVKSTPVTPAKIENKPLEAKEVMKGSKVDILKSDESTCPLCKGELNLDSKGPPNYNTCTECKTLVCNLCGFNPVPQTEAKEWLCLNCHTQKALLGQHIPQPSPVSVPQENQAIPAAKKAEPQPSPAQFKPEEVVVKPPCTATSTEAVPTAPTAEVETPIPSLTNVELESALLPKAVDISKLQEKSKQLVEPDKPKIVSLVPDSDVPQSVTIDRKEEFEKSEATTKPELTESTLGVLTNETKLTSSEKITLETLVVKDQNKQSEPPESEQKGQEQSQEQTDFPPLIPIDSHHVVDISKPEPTKDMTCKAGDETVVETLKLEKPPEEVENRAKPKLALKAMSIDEVIEPQILPFSEDLNAGQSKNDAEDNSLPVKAAVQGEKRRLSFQAMEESSGSDITPSPVVQRRMLKVSDVSSTSEENKSESADSSVEDEDFIRSQIMGMGDEKEISVLKDEKETKLDNEEAIRKAELHNSSVKSNLLSGKGSTYNEGALVWTKSPLASEETTKHETVPSVTLKKAIPVVKHRQSTDEEVESITESLSKGSSSMHVSSLTPGSSPTSASSLEEDSDSSPSHRRTSGDKQYRKGKHRHATQPLPTIEDSSEEEKSRKDKNQLNLHGRSSPNKNSSPAEDLRQVRELEEAGKTSGSEYWASIESESEVRQAVQRGGKPSPTVIPYSPSESFEGVESASKSLKSADQAYEDILEKAKAIPGDSPPGVEPLYGGMSIEDYLYESLVEEPEIMMAETKPETSPEPLKKLRSPEEVYEEMMEKKRELMMIEQEFKQAQTALESSSSSVTPPETCVVIMATEATLQTGDSTTDTSKEASVKKKKRPAPPRPTEPPKRTDGTVLQSTISGPIGFVRPMVPLDPALRKALFPIPDLKITQCSSGEEEDDSLADEYGVGISSDITPSDDSETKDDQPISPPMSEPIEIEPIIVVCEIPEAKPIPTPISAPELTTTPSPISPQSPPTSPATPDFSLESNTSSSSYQAQTPQSSDSTPLTTPTMPLLTQTPREVSHLIGVKDEVFSRESSAVIVAIPDVVSDPKADMAEPIQAGAFPRDATFPTSEETPPAVVVEMPDLVSSPSQMPMEGASMQEALAKNTEPVAVTAKPTVQFTELPPVSIIQESVPPSPHVSTTSAVSAIPPHEPVNVQMPDLVSTTSQFSTQISSPVSSITTITDQAQPHVVQPAAAPIIPVSAPLTTAIVKKKVPPPPPPRSTSVSLPDQSGARLPTRGVQHISTIMSSTVTKGATVSSQPMQSVAVDIQPRMEDMSADDAAVAQIVTPTRAGHVVIIVPSVENKSRICQTPQNSTIISTASQAPTTESALSSTEVSTGPVPPLPPKPVVRTNIEPVEISLADTHLYRPSTLPRPNIYPKPPVSAPSTAQVSLATGTSLSFKAPPPIPPKPVIIPAGLVFSHKPGESVKPPPVVMSKAATLPRTKPPPNALSLSLTRPVESKSGASSPKSPLSPRHAKSLKTYVVITLPSEPGSPTEVITVQAPMRRGSIPATKGPGVRTTPLEQKTPSETFPTQDQVRRTSVPTLRHPSPIAVASTLPLEQVEPNHTLVREVLPERESYRETPIQVHNVPDPIKKPYTPVVMQQQQAVYHSLPSKTMHESIIWTPAINAQKEEKPHFDSSVSQQPKLTPEGITLPQESSVDAQVPVAQIQTMPTQQPLTQHVSIMLEPRLGDDVLIPQESTVTVYSNTEQHKIEVENTQLQPEIQMVEKLPVAVSPQLHTAMEQTPYSAASWMTLQAAIEPQKDYVVTIPDVPTLSQVDKEVAPAPPLPMSEIMSPSFVLEGQHVTPYLEQRPITYAPQVYRTLPSTVMPIPTPPLEATVRQAPLSTELQPQTVVLMPHEVIVEQTPSDSTTTEKPPYTSSEIFTFPTDYEMLRQVPHTDGLASTRRQSLKTQQPLVINMPAEKDVPSVVSDNYTSTFPEEPQLSKYPSELDRPLETKTTEAFTRRTSLPAIHNIPPCGGIAPITITKIQQESIESQEIRGPEKVVSSMSRKYSSSVSTTGQPAEILPSLVTQVVTTEVQRTTVSVVHERLPQQTPPSAGTAMLPDESKYQVQPKQNGKMLYHGDVIDLRTVKVGAKMTEQGMDLTPPELYRHSSSDPVRQITAVQPEIVNLSAEVVPAATLALVTDSITIVTCTATIASYGNPPAEKPLDLQGPVTSLPLPLTTYKPCEPLAQIVYRPVSAPPVVTFTAQELPMNLSYGAIVSGRKQPMTPTSTDMNSVLALEATGAMDLSNYRPVRSMVALSGTSSEVVTTVIEDDGTPVDLTAGRRSVCCDVIYKLPFTGSCRTQPPVTTQPDKNVVHRDDDHQYDGTGQPIIHGVNGEKALISEASLSEVGLFPYDPNKDYHYLNGSTDSAIDLTASQLSTGKALDYTSKATAAMARMTPSPSSQDAFSAYSVSNALRISDGMVYSSVSVSVPSTYAVTTQPGSIFSTSIVPISAIQNQSAPQQFSYNPDQGQMIPYDTGLLKELFPTALADIKAGYPEMYSDATLEALAASLDAFASSPIFPGLDNTKMAQYQMEREFLELEKLKQLCLAEELEWERQEIQRYREQEQLMVQQELEELQGLKQQLLMQQEEEHHAHMVAQQQTYVQQKEQLQQIQQLQLQLQRQLEEHYGSTGTTTNFLEAKYAGVGDSGQYWPVKDESTGTAIGTRLEERQDQNNIPKRLQVDQETGKKIIDSGVQTDDEDSAEKQHVGRRKKSKRNIDSSAQSDDEDQDELDTPAKSRRRPRKHSGEGKHNSKVSSIAIQTVAEISVQTDHSGSIKRPKVQMDTKVEIIKHISAPESSQRGGSLSCQTDSDRRHTPIEVGYNTHLTTDAMGRSRGFYTTVSPISHETSVGGQKMLTADANRFSSCPRLKPGQKSFSDPKSLSPAKEDRMGVYYAETYSGRGTASGTGKKVKRTLPDPPPEDDLLMGRSGYSTNSARRRLARSTTMARAKILQDIDKELNMVERESSKLRKKQAELDEEEKEIDAKLRLWAKRLP